MPLSLHLDDATEYATVYDGERPVATVQRRRVYTDEPAWRVFNLHGQQVAKITYHLNYPYVTRLILQRLARVLATARLTELT